jgi:hypothetical protein
MTHLTMQNTIDRLEDQNRHTDVAMYMAEKVGGELGGAMLTVLKEIDAQHELMGYMPADLRDARDGIAKMLRKNCEARGWL